MSRWLCGNCSLLALVVLAAAAPAPEDSETAAKKLATAFGANHKAVLEAKIIFEVKYPEWVFACNEFVIQPDGWVKITPGYVAMFDGLPKPGERLGIIGEAPHLHLKFDRPVKSIADMSQAKFKTFEAREGLQVQDFGKPAVQPPGK